MAPSQTPSPSPAHGSRLSHRGPIFLALLCTLVIVMTNGSRFGKRCINAWGWACARPKEKCSEGEWGWGDEIRGEKGRKPRTRVYPICQFKSIACRCAHLFTLCHHIRTHGALSLPYPTGVMPRDRASRIARHRHGSGLGPPRSHELQPASHPSRPSIKGPPTSSPTRRAPHAACLMPHASAETSPAAASEGATAVAAASWPWSCPGRSSTKPCAQPGWRLRSASTAPPQ